MSQAKNKKILSIVGAVVALVAIVVAAVVAYKYLGNKKPDDTDPKITTLSAPQNVAFDKDSYILSWNSVSNASGYQVSYNDVVTDVVADSTSTQIFITSQQNTFKVKAIGNGVDYSDSSWSTTVTYTIDQTPSKLSTFEKVNLELAKIAQENNMELKRVIGISYVNTERFNGDMNLRFETLCVNKNAYKDDILERVQIYIGFDEKRTETEMLENIKGASDTWIYKEKIVNYNSAQYMLDGKALTGNMLELQNQGIISL